MAAGKGEQVEGEAASGRALAFGALLAVAAGAGYAVLGGFDVFAALGAHGSAALAWSQDNLPAAVALYVLGFVAVVALSLPGAFAMTVAGGFLFGLVPGTALAVASATLGALAIFLAVRFGVGETVRHGLLARGPDRVYGRIERGLRENAALYLLLLRLVPAIPFPVANVAPAFFGVRARTFALTTFFGIMPGTALTAWIGHGLHGLLGRGERPELSLFREPELMGPIAALAIVLALPLLAKRLRRP